MDQTNSYMEVGAARLLAVVNSYGHDAHQALINELAHGLENRGIRASQAMLLFACGICTQQEFDAGVEEAMMRHEITPEKKVSN